jgi:type I restriction enzyme S subunit
MLPAGAVLYTSRAPIGYVAIASNAISTNQGFKSLILKDGYVPEFVFYLLKASKSEIESHASGGTFAEISAKALSEVVLQFPPKAQQEAIAKLLKSFDEKIATNNALSKTLEDIAQTIFESWFIDFDPVKAKMVGEKPVGMDDVTAALFPDSMEESELGLVPQGWEVSPSTEFFEVLSGGTPKTSNEDYWNGDIPWFSVVDAPDSQGCFFIKTNKTITKEGLDNSAAKLVRPGVTVISARGTVGKTAIVAIPSTFNQSCYGIEGKFGDFFTYLLLRNQVVKLQNISHGGMFDTITRETFSAIKVAKPKPELVSIFESLVSPVFLEIRNLQFQSNDLASIRDSLLPRLISGELQIPEEMLAY